MTEMTTDTDARAFEDVMAGWDEEVPCGSVFPCRSEATWWVNQHGCERKAVCTTHLMRWVQDCLAILCDACVHCPDCDRTFGTVEELATIRPL